MPHPRERACVVCGAVRQRRGDTALAPRCRPCALAAYNGARPRKTPEELEQQRAEYRRRRHAELRDSGARYRAQLRLDAIAAYGGQCRHCGETDPAVLALDHVRDDGAQERRQSGGQGGYKLYLRLRRAGWPQGGHQLLCHNCNYRKELARRQRAPDEATHGKTTKAGRCRRSHNA